MNKEIAIANAVLQNLPSVNSRTSYNELGCKNKIELVNTYFLYYIELEFFSLVQRISKYLFFILYRIGIF